MCCMPDMQAAKLERLRNGLDTFVEMLTDGLGRMERRRAIRWYIQGLLLDGERKSMEPLAARLVQNPAETEAMRQRLQQCITISEWDESEVRRRVALEADTRLSMLEAFIIDDTGFPKKGEHSVGVARQYSGTLGRVDSCQVTPSLHLAGEGASVCISQRLYLPASWAEDPERRAVVGVPEHIDFKKKWQIALDLIDEALAWGVKPRPVLADAGYGEATEFRRALDARELPYVVGVPSTTLAWRTGEGALPPVPRQPGSSRRGKKRSYRGAKPISVAELARERGRQSLHVISWRQGSRGPQSSRFGMMRVRVAHGYHDGRDTGQVLWLLYEWPRREPAPTSYWLSSLPFSISRRKLVYMAKLRWRVERDYQEMKEELGLDHFEGRTWRGFHHHLALCAAAHAFLTLLRVLSPPGPSPGLDDIDARARASAGARAPHW